MAFPVRSVLVVLALFACSRTELEAPIRNDPAKLRPIAPLSTSTVTTQRPTFHWTGGDGAEVEVCKTRACDVIEASATSSLTSATLATDLSPGVHFFRLRALVNGAPGSETTPVWEFRVPHRSSPRDTSWGVFPDFDGDGFADLIVRPLVAFATEIYPGSPTGITEDHRIEVVIPEPNIVGIATAIGDVDGDGFGDLVIARGGLYPSTKGVVYIYRGGPIGVDPSKPSYTLDAPSDPDGIDFGVWVASAGDLNGDGYADLIVDAPNESTASTDEGRVYIYFGGPSGPATTPTTTLHSDGKLGFAGDFGQAGDVDGDGFADIVLLSESPQVPPHDATTYLYHGSASGPSDATRTTLDAQFDDVCAKASATPADFDGDGLADIAIGFTRCNAPIGPGVMTIFWGDTTIAKTTVTPPAGFAGFGFFLKSGGDIDGDGFDDLVASMETGDANTGAIVFWGSKSGISQSNQTVFDVTIDPGARNAYGVATSDLDGDGLDDVTLAPITAMPITTFSLSQGSLQAKGAETPPGASQFYEPVMR